MTLWEQMQEFLDFWNAAGYTTFTNHDVAHMLSISPSRASDLISAYLGAMTKPNCATKFHIRRGEGRTTNALWHIGHSVKDARATVAQFADDTENRIEKWIEPWMDHIAEHNPKAVNEVFKIGKRFGKLIQQLQDLAKPA